MLIDNQLGNQQVLEYLTPDADGIAASDKSPSTRVERGERLLHAHGEAAANGVLLFLARRGERHRM